MRGDVRAPKELRGCVRGMGGVSSKAPANPIIDCRWGGLGSRKRTGAIRANGGIGEHHLAAGLTPDELRKLYSSALAVITASFEEGFSYSGAEAMQCGTCVLASEIACHREIYGDAPVYFDPQESGSLYRAMNRVLRMSNGERAEKVELGWQQVASYSESKVSNAWEDVIHAIRAR